MARSRTTTRLSLERWARVMGLSIVHFNNLRDNDQEAQAKPYWTQTAHDDLATFIAQAEYMLREGDKAEQYGLGFDVCPVARSSMFVFVPDVDPWWKAVVKLLYGHVQDLGAESWTALEADVTVPFSDDTATITLTGMASDINPEEVYVYYRTADGADAARDPGFEIRDLHVVVSGTTITITGHKAQFVKLSVLEADEPADYATASNFVTAVDVYRMTVDDELPVTIHWDRYAETATGDPGSDITQDGTARLTDKRQGWFQPRPAAYSGGAHSFEFPTYSGEPDRLTVAYVAGYAWGSTAYRRIAQPLEMAVVRLANVLSPNYEHGLSDLASLKWQSDRKVDRNSPLQPGEKESPFGLTEGARFAWRVIRQMQLLRRPF